VTSSAGPFKSQDFTSFILKRFFLHIFTTCVRSLTPYSTSCSTTTGSRSLKIILKRLYYLHKTSSKMKFTTIIYATLLAVASVDAAATAAPLPAQDVEAVNQFCHSPGQPCNKLKRAAEAIAEAMADPAANPVAMADPVHHFCYRPGEPCSKAKRDALAMAEAVAEAYAAAAPTAEADPARKSRKHPLPVSSTFAYSFATATVSHWCYRPGEPCSKTKRAAEALAAAIAEPNAQPDAEADPVHHFCYRPGEPCSKHKRALEQLSRKVKKI